MGEIGDGFVSVVLGLGDIVVILEFVYFDFLGFIIFGGVDYVEFVGVGGDEVFGLVLVVKGVVVNDDGFFLFGN